MSEALGIGKAVNKAHRKSKSGAKANKKANKDGKVERYNPKAFSVANVVRTKRNLQRNLDKSQQKEYVPQINKAIEITAPPPTMVVVMGPPKSGKTTLIRSLIKCLTNRSIQEVKGPITITANKKKRLTFFECPNNDTCAMIDLAKIADLVLLMVDGSFGFEMETFEFLNILQVHGFPKVMGILTHLDKFSNESTLKKMRKRLKARFWTEIYDGAKMFYLSGIVRSKREDGRDSQAKYPKGEIRNMCLHISRMKFRPLVWRNTHPYVVVDRFEDITNSVLIEDNSKCDRSITFYGYVRGSNLKESMKVHLIGAGDYDMSDISALSDPCPLPQTSNERFDEKNKKIIKRTTLKNKETAVYAPMADIGSVRIDQDAVYIDIGNQPLYTKKHLLEGGNEKENDDYGSDSYEGEGVGLLRDLQDIKQGFDSKLKLSEIKIFDKGKSVKGEDVVTTNESSNVSSEREGSNSSDDSNSYVESDEDNSKTNEPRKNDTKWKESMAEKAALRFLERTRQNVDLMELVYGKENNVESGDESESGEESFLRLKTDHKKSKRVEDNSSNNDISKKTEILKTWDDGKIESIRNKFVTGNWGKESGMTGESIDAKTEGDDVFDGISYGPNGEVLSDSEGETKHLDYDKLRERNAIEKAKVMSERVDDQDPHSSGKDGEENKEEGVDEEAMAFMKEAKKMVEQQSSINKDEFSKEGEVIRAKLEGFKQGVYVRVRIDGVSAEFIENFDLEKPIIMGGLPNHELTKGIIRARVKRHRWHDKILKSSDPLIFSIGWRRFQSIPVYSMEEESKNKHRFLKYTPEHMHCECMFFGPISPTGTGLLAIQNLNESGRKFRISLTGTVLELDANISIVKKLRLLGYPYKIHRKTAFIKGMFSSDLEVAKFEGASIKTVSGIRGQIKKAAGAETNASGGNMKGGGGRFRATFEDKILMSDIAFCNLWAPVEVKRFYNPVTSLLDGSNWQGMKNTATLRIEKKIPVPLKKDSLYKPIVRTTKKHKPMLLPKHIQEALPYASKLKHKQKKNSYLKERAVISEPSERKKSSLMNALSLIRKEKVAVRKASVKRRREEKAKKMAREKDAFKDIVAAEKKRKYRNMGQRQEKAAKEAKLASVS
mmetsp:Transcript_4751/g.7175  ORF Transcript_4751/g.7175 Transcript_4751/m.7175 type:complete len:1116 (-) Transcript_4751:7-3354(-)